jgi:regulatory protein YycI of two-component signal transduction system YycFG
MRKKIFIVIWLLGVVLLFSFRTPVKYYQFYDQYVVVYTHIFSDRGKIMAGQLVFYLLIWSAIILLTYFVLKSVKKTKAKA